MQLQEWHTMLALPGDEWQAVEPNFDPCRQRGLQVMKGLLRMSINLFEVHCVVQDAPGASLHRVQVSIGCTTQ